MRNLLVIRAAQRRLLAVVLTLCVVGGVAASPTNVATEHTDFVQIQPTGDIAIEGSLEFRFKAMGCSFLITNQSAAAEGETVVSLPIDRESGEHVVRLFFAEFKGDLLVAYELSNLIEGWGRITRFEGAGHKSRWTAAGLGFNLARPVVEGDCVYLSSIGFVGKLDLVSGKFVWKHSDLYERNKAFGSFKPTDIRDRLVCFTGDAPFGEEPRTLAFDKATGEEASKCPVK